MAHAGTSVSRSIRRGRICLFKALVAFAVSMLPLPAGLAWWSFFDLICLSHSKLPPLHNQLTLELLKPGGLCQHLFCPVRALRGLLAPIRVLSR